MIKSIDLLEQNRYAFLCNIVSGTLPFKFQWLKNGHPIAGKHHDIDTTAHFSMLTIGNISKSDSGIYKCFVQNSFGADSSTTELNVKGFVLMLRFLAKKWRYDCEARFGLVEIHSSHLQPLFHLNVSSKCLFKCLFWFFYTYWSYRPCPQMVFDFFRVYLLSNLLISYSCSKIITIFESFVSTQRNSVYFGLQCLSRNSTAAVSLVPEWNLDWSKY